MARLDIKVRDRLGAVEFLEIDHSGRMFLFAENIPVSGGTAGAFVAQYSPAGVLQGIYELPLSNVPLSRRFVTVSGDGDVYFLRTQSNGVDVLGLGFRTVSGKVIDIRLGSPPSAPSAHGPVAAVRPLTRQRVIETAFAFEGIQWTVNAGAYGSDPDTVCTGYGGRIRRPSYLYGKLGQQVRGIPYCWGCFGSFEQIRSKIERGVLAGNVCTRNAPRSDAAGVDCSAFVSAAWGLASHFTTQAIPAIAKPIDPVDLRPGDALNKPGSHVMLFLRFTSDRMAEVIRILGRLQRPRLSQCLPAFLAAGAGLRPGSFSRSGERYQCGGRGSALGEAPTGGEGAQPKISATFNLTDRSLALSHPESNECTHRGPVDRGIRRLVGGRTRLVGIQQGLIVTSSKALM